MRKNKAYKKMLAARKCWYQGHPKAAYASLLEAQAACALDQQPYTCTKHGWHIGGILSRDLRAAMRTATHKE